MSEELDRHLAQSHQYDAETVDKMVAEHRMMVDEVVPQISMMIDDFYGERHPTVADPQHREGGRLEKYDAAMAQIEGGKVSLSISAGAWVAVTGLITALGVIAVAVINIAFG